MRLRGITAVVLAPLTVVACAAPPAPAGVAAEQDAVTTPPRPARERIVVHGTGDVSLDPVYIPAFREHGYEHAWSGLGGLFAADDLTIVNLECPVSTRGEPVEKAFTFRCDPAALPAARAAGVEVANFANNHIRDFGRDAMLDSIRHAHDAGIAPVGIGADLAAATAPAILERGGWRIAVLGFGGVVPDASWLATTRSPGLASGDDVDLMVEAVRAADAVADLVFVTIHWGMELDTEPRADDIGYAEAMIEAGADGIFGHHQHRLGPLGEHAGRPIAWGLGNFVWPRLSTESATTAVARFVVDPDGAVHGCLIPAVIARHGHPELAGPAPC
ncbi:MAG TPA: CapA family protein [Pseudonocardia sp.]|jgi:poly-gamma-glutamate synthesis protein (capsule biosynthesis protein)|uniref:CapA family protein n=1 Tax=Pseudonocardia sp. TaxID=60912 RepID=UPI002B4B562A|nr:CapA family protein [Pseudonocardia sp.]HLU58432.1 CapA family protein [Pseudonocardia sp.]